MVKIIHYNNFRNLQREIKRFRELGFNKEIFEVKKDISEIYKGNNYELHIKYSNGSSYYEIIDTFFEDFLLHGFWIIRKDKNNNVIEKYHIKEYETIGDDI